VEVVIKKKIGDDITAQKPMTSFKQVARHMMAFFGINRPGRAIFRKT
jgi:hypothetical protein